MTLISKTLRLLKCVAATVFFAVLPLKQVVALPLTYTFDGYITGRLEYNSFTPTPFTITANADTADIAAVRFTNGVTLFSLDTDTATMFIEGIGEFEFAMPTRIFIYRDAVINGLGPINELGFGRGGIYGDPLIGFAAPAFASYDLASEFGPMFLGNTLLGGAIPTTLGVLSIGNVTDVTFAARSVMPVPEPSTYMLVLVALGAACGVMRNRRHQG